MRLLYLRHWWVIVLLLAVVASLAVGLGQLRVTALVTKSNVALTVPPATSKFDISNAVNLFDDTIVHEIIVQLSQQQYDQLISIYQQTGEKIFVSADVLIDGVLIQDVGVRLKGNSSLRSAVGGNNRAFPGGDAPNAAIGQDRPQGQANQGDRPARLPPNEDAQAAAPADGAEAPQSVAPARDAPDGAPVAGGEPGSAENVKIPLLLRFDKYVEDQTYQGLSAIAIRTYGPSYDEAMLQEPVTNAMARLAGLPATRTSYASLTVPGKEAALYVISEIIDTAYLARYAEHQSGVLFKAEIGSTMDYIDDNPSSYSGAFSQETRVNDADLAPLIGLMRFIAQADDATFEAELPAWLEVDAFALYLAVNNLMVNYDSMAGTSNNYYLYYDEASGRFTCFLWDTNESLGKLRIGEGATANLYFERTAAGQPAGDRQGGGMFGGENKLISRFLASPVFRALYEQKLTFVYQTVFQSGAIEAEVARISEVIHTSGTGSAICDLTAYDQAVADVLDFIAQRQAYLASTPLLAAGA